jgi:hypothetical protein
MHSVRLNFCHDLFEQLRSRSRSDRDKSGSEDEDREDRRRYKRGQFIMDFELKLRLCCQTCTFS